ncbi:MAG: AarF/UbiB family protein [Acidimicrobiales bacterium]
MADRSTRDARSAPRPGPRHSGSEPSGTPRANDSDLAIGAFSAHGPWTVDPATMSWRFPLDTGGEIDTLRRRAAALAHRLVRPEHVPSVSRVLAVGWRLGWALLAWGIRDRGTAQSRAGLSRRLRPAFERLGPTYIKLGQIISSGEGIFPEELVDEFRLLRDRVPPEPFSTVRRTIEEELGRPLSEVFVSFDRTPVASASIAQVHAATLRSGERVVVKVQRRTVASLVRLDIAAMSWIAPMLVGRIPVTALTNPPALVELFAETIVEELDFRLEAQNMLDIAAVFAVEGQRSVVVPRPHPELVTKRVLVMEHLRGYAWGDAAAMRLAGIDTAAVLRCTLIAFLEGTLLYGVFHGDLHSGNLLVQDDGTVALLDFGITGRLDERKRLAFLRLEMGATTNDVAIQVEALRDLGALPADADVAAVIRDLGLDRPPVDPTTMNADQMVAELREVTKALLGYGARLPKELMLFVKNILFLNGAMATMAPDVDILGEVVAIATYFTERHGEQIARDVGSDALTTPIDLDGYRAALGFTDEVESITFNDLQERRELIRRRLQQGAKQQRRHSLRSIARALYRTVRGQPAGPG